MNEFANSFKQKSGQYVCEWILRVWDDAERNRTWNQAKFFDLGPLSGESRFKTETYMNKKYQKFCFNGLLKCLSKDGLPKRSWRCLFPLA